MTAPSIFNSTVLAHIQICPQCTDDSKHITDIAIKAINLMTETQNISDFIGTKRIDSLTRTPSLDGLKESLIEKIAELDAVKALIEPDMFELCSKICSHTFDSTDPFAGFDTLVPESP